MSSFKNSKIVKFIINKIRNERFSFNCLVVGFIAIASNIVFGTVVSIVNGEAWEKVEGCIENTFLAFILLFIIVNYWKGNKGFVESLTGELLAIYLVTNTTYFVETLIEVIESENTILDYIYLTMEFLLMGTSLAVFIDHLYKSDDTLAETSNRIIINILLILVFVALIVDFILIILYNDPYYTLKLVDEIIYVIFGVSLAFCVLSSEFIRMEEVIKNKKGNK